MRTQTTRFTVSVFLLLCTSFLNSGCEKYVKQGELEGGVALTFDDNYIDDWYAHLPLLDSFGARATFYVSSYYRLSGAQRNKLKILQQHGNEIAFHTTHHVDMVEFLRTKTLQQLMKQEVKDGLDSMAKDGFYPKSFAFPYGKHNDLVDAALLSIFRSVRALNGTKDYTQSVCRKKGKTFFRGLGMDDDSKPNHVITEMLINAKHHHNAVVLVGHRINSRLRPNMSSSKLRFILQQARDLELKYYTIEELSR
jgi:peptidoglycan/xylan/chitin deacetylase (PgdA/CDA1 family)